MDCALWLNRRKIHSAAEIAQEPDIASLRGYFLAGSLLPWLREHGGVRYAKKLAKISPDDPELNEKLAAIFGGSAEGKRFGEGAPAAPNTGFCGSYAPCLFGSFGYPTGSFGGSFRFGSGMHEWEWEWLFELYKSGSFTLGSFSGFNALSSERLFAALRSGSFAFGSFRFGSFPTDLGSLYAPFAFDPAALDEYDRIMLETLMLCPLDRFGYGIHNI
ncbi:MAG: hypothetical protein NC299_09190 [Lachnospiraceae bacterium]|nr:hypothetical protein [Ruminococcus sp.]MCM1275527.1 hypothetical protein [Lachnospiraceae bacterium]